MTGKKAAQEKLSRYAARIADQPKTDFRNTELVYPHGEKGDFRKITVTLPPDIYEAIVDESSRRKKAAEPNHLLASIVREAVVSYLGKK